MATHELGLSSTAIAAYAKMSQPAISKVVKRGTVFCEEKEIDLDVLTDG